MPLDSALLRSLTTLGDMARLRLLRLIEREELSVGELAKVMQLPQSTVSRHLKLLLDGKWAMRRSEGTASLYRMHPKAGPGAGDLWRVVRAQLGESPTFDEDDRRLAEVLAERRSDSRAFFGRVAGEWDEVRRELFGESFTSEALLSLLSPSWVVADLGCGAGSTAEQLAPIVARVIAVDREPAMLAAARKRLARFDNVEFRKEDVTALSIGPGAVDAAVASLLLVALPDPASLLGEMARILKPGGCGLVIDAVSHDRQSYRHTMGHLHLGFDEAQIEAWAAAAGFAGVHYRRLRADTAAKGPGLFAAALRK